MMEPGPPQIQQRGGFPADGATPNRQNYKFSPEEMRVLKECNQESFYQRSLPLAAFLAGSTWFAVNNNMLKPNPRYGAVPKMIAAVVVGYFVGKLSYQPKCAEKLMQLPNSAIGDMLRKRRKGNITDTMDPTFGAGMSFGSFSNVNPSEVYSDSHTNPSNNLDIDTTRPDMPGLEDNHRPSLDNPTFEEEMPPQQKHATTYDELRKMNREEYQQKRLGTYKEPTKTAPPAPAQNQFGTDEIPKSPKNKYGDVWG